MRPFPLAALLTLTATDAGAFPHQPPPNLPETYRGTVQGPGIAHPADKPVDTLRDLIPALAACWRAPEGTARFERTEITARFSLRRDGSVIGTPRITFASTPGEAQAVAILTEATLQAIRRCTPVAVTPALGGAIAGRPLAIRFVYEGPRGQGI